MSKTIWISVVMMALAGCSNNLPEPEGKTMLDLYEQSTHGGSTASGVPVTTTTRPVTIAPRDNMHKYVRSVDNEYDNLFGRLPNPTLYLFIPPHLVSEEGLPIPGYTIPFPMYERTPYALPHEIAQ